LDIVSYAQEISECVRRDIAGWDSGLASRVQVALDLEGDPAVVIAYYTSSGRLLGTRPLPVFFPGNDRNQPLDPAEAASEMMPDVLHGGSIYHDQ
jgi:hypothetical protein